MEHLETPETELLLRRALGGDASAVEHLFSIHRARLKRMVAVRVDQRLKGRIDPSDLVQETALEPVRKLPHYLQQRDYAFYPWLRQITWEKLIQAHRQHLYAQRRSVRREAALDIGLSDKSVTRLASLIQVSQSTPSNQAVRKELHQRVQSALERLNPRDREILVLQHLEQLKLQEVAAVLGISVAAAQSRYRRAIERLHELLGAESLVGDIG